MPWLALLALIWLAVAALALQARRGGSVRLTRRWTTRLYAVSLVPLSALVIGSVLVGVQVMFVEGMSTATAVGEARTYALWLAPLVNLVIVDMLLRHRSGEEHRARVMARRVALSSQAPDWPRALRSARLPASISRSSSSDWTR